MSLVIDPESGWMYGFPKVFDETFREYWTLSHREIEEWLMANGYPIQQVAYWRKHGRGVPLRFWRTQ